MIFLLGAFLVSSFATATATATTEETGVIYLPKDALLNKTIEVPHLLTAIHQPSPVGVRPLPASLPSLLLKPLFADGRKCSPNRDQRFFGRVEKTLLPRTPLTITKIFFTMSREKPLLYHTLKWTFSLLSLVEWHKFRGGVGLDYLVQDTEGETYIIDDVDIDPALFYRYQGNSAKKARHILSAFHKKEGDLNPTGTRQAKSSGQVLPVPQVLPFEKAVTLILEGHAEYIDKCGYYQSPQDLAKKRETEIQEGQKSYQRILAVVAKAPSDHLYKNTVRTTETQVEMRVNEKALALLLLNSSFLRIKDIKIRG